MTMQQLAAAQTSAEVSINENFQTLDWASVYGRRHAVTTGLTWGYYGGLWGGLTVADGTVTLTNSATNYIVVLRSTGAVSVSASATNWVDVPTYARVYALTVAGSGVTVVADHRAGPFGVFGAFPARRLVSLSAAYTFVLADMAAEFLHPGSDATARTWTIPANASVAFPIGTEIPGFNPAGAGVLTISITTDTLRLAGAGTTGSRTVAANGEFRLKKVAATEWQISGVGVT